MWFPRRLPLVLALLDCALANSSSTATVDKLTVKAITGVYTGIVDPEFPAVRQFRSIPYAEAPLGKLRWMPPVPVTPSLRHSHANRFPPPCPQYLSRNLTTWNSNITNFSIRLHGQSRIAGDMAQTSSEDCLYLAIWTPLNATLDSNLPVALFIPGGSFVNGGVDVPYQQPTPWIQRTQRHIFVSTNYRVNIAGFPWAAGLDDQNLGILDQRAALEWVYANIPAFGGDRSRITLWGHSAGGVAADMLAHAYPDNSLASGLFLQSGTAMVNISHPDPTHSNFTFVARNLGCDFPSSPAAEIACMRQVPMALIQNFIGQYRDNGSTSPDHPALGVFKPLPDERVVFFNYTARAAQGRLARIPALVSTTSNEQASLTRYPADDVAAGPDRARVDRETVDVFVCLASNTTRARERLGLTTYRYEYAGNFSSLTPLPWLGAYHASDVPMLFGTFEGREGVTAFQREVAVRMQDDVLAFMEDPETGLRRRGWLPWGETAGSEVVGGKTMVRFASGGVAGRNVSADDIDDACVLGKRYNSSP